MRKQTDIETEIKNINKAMIHVEQYLGQVIL